MLSNDGKVGAPCHAKAWNLPVHMTCCAEPDKIASWSCRAVCYCFQHADRKHLVPMQERAFKIANRNDFADIMIGAIHDATVSTIRIHSFGDFSSVEYIEAWTQIVKECDGVQFLAYTRAWRIVEFNPALTDLAALPNMNLFLSFDRDTGIPPEIPRTKLAWLACTDNDPPPVKVWVVFRGTDERTPERPPHRRYYSLVQLGTRLNEQFVCPHENGLYAPGTKQHEATEDCVTCRKCFFKEKACNPFVAHQHLP
ncbi:MAG: hypothetical protein IID42_08885 [Planctomycetes bacterium]|nr:hypothetical protein [Planctomycetota bacterium]